MREKSGLAYRDHVSQKSTEAPTCERIDDLRGGSEFSLRGGSEFLRGGSLGSEISEGRLSPVMRCDPPECIRCLQTKF